MGKFFKLADKYRTQSEFDDQMVQDGKKVREETSSNITDTNLDTGEVTKDYMKETKKGKRIKAVEKTTSTGGDTEESEAKTTIKNPLYTSEKTTYTDESGDTKKKHKLNVLGLPILLGEEQDIKNKKHEKHMDKIGSVGKFFKGATTAAIINPGTYAKRKIKEKSKWAREHPYLATGTVGSWILSPGEEIAHLTGYGDKVKDNSLVEDFFPFTSGFPIGDAIYDFFDGRSEERKKESFHDMMVRTNPKYRQKNEARLVSMTGNPEPGGGMEPRGLGGYEEHK